MVFKNPREQGSRTPIDLRLGITIEKFGGVDLEKDAGAISDQRFRSLINGMVGQGPIRERGGQAKSNTESIGNIEGFIDTSDLGAFDDGPAGAGVREYQGALINTTPWWNAEEPGRLLSVDSNQDPVVYSLVGDLIDIAQELVDEKLFVLLTDDDGVDTLAQVISWQGRHTVWTAPVDEVVGNSTTQNLSQIAVSGGKVYMAGMFTNASLGTTELRIFTWNPNTPAVDPVLDKTFPAADPAEPAIAGQIFFPFEDGVIFVYRDFVSQEWIFNKRTSAGVWSVLTRPAGITRLKPGGGDILAGTLYIGCTGLDAGVRSGIVVSYAAGAALTLVRSFASTCSAPVFTAFKTFDGKIYYGYSSEPGAQKLWVGQFDTGVWTDEYVNVYDNGTFEGVLSSWVAGGNIYFLAALRAPDVGTQYRGVYVSDGTDVSVLEEALLESGDVGVLTEYHQLGAPILDGVVLIPD